MMEDVHSYERLLECIKNSNEVMLYTTNPDCSVCHADFPKVEQLAEEYHIRALHIDITEMPEAAGQMNLFSSPTVILFYEGKEFHRQARIIDFEALSYRLKQLKNNS